jgi:hypothetical protein
MTLGHPIRDDTASLFLVMLPLAAPRQKNRIRMRIEHIGRVGLKPGDSYKLRAALIDERVSRQIRA